MPSQRQQRQRKHQKSRLAEIVHHAGGAPARDTLATIYDATAIAPPSGSVGVRVAAYCRYSSHNQDDGYSLEYQHEAIEHRRAALDSTWHIRFYDEPATSAYTENLSKRPVFLRMLADAANGEIDLVVVYNIQRFARKQAVTMSVIPALQAVGVQFLSLTEGVDVATPMGKAVMGISSAIAELDSDLKSDMVSAGKLQRAKSGLPASRLPLGYRWNRAQGIPELDDTGDAPALLRLFQLALSGLDDYSVALQLNTEGYRQHTHSRLRNPDGTFDTDRLFTRNTIGAVRTNTFYRPFTPGDDRGTIPYLDAEYRGQHQAALDWDTWQQLQGLARNRRRGWGARPGAVTTPYTAEFRGLVVCAECHHRLDVARSRPNATGVCYEYYHCRGLRRISRCGHHGLMARVEEVRALWIAWVAEHLTLPADWQALIHDRWRDDAPTNPGDDTHTTPTPAQMHAERLRWQDERERTIEVYVKGWKDQAWMEARMAEIDAMLAALDRAQRPRPAEEARLLHAGTVIVNLAALWMDAYATTEQRITLASHLIAPSGLVLDVHGVQKRYNPRRPDTLLPPTCTIVAVQLQPAFHDLMQLFSAIA